MHVKFRNHSVVKEISSYCDLNNIEFHLSETCDGDHFDTELRRLCIHLDSSKSLAYRLFITAHEYGHAYQYVNGINRYDGSDEEEVYNNLMDGKKVNSRSKRKIIRSLLKNEFDATQIGLTLLRTQKCYPPHHTLALIKRKANMQLIYHYLTLNYGYDIRHSDNFMKNIEIPNTFLVPFSSEFNYIVKQVKPIVHNLHNARSKQ